MNLDEIPQYRATAMKKISENQNIKDYLTGTTNSTVESTSLLFNYIYPYCFLPGIQTEAKTYVVMSVSVPRVINRTFNKVKLEIYVFTHDKLIACVDPTTKKTRLRYDLIASEIDKMFNGSAAFGLKLELVSTKDISPIDKYYGTCLVYESADFNYKV